MSGDIAGAVGGGVDTTGEAPTGDFRPLPGGWYPLLIEKAQVSENKAKNGHVLRVSFSVLGDRYNNRKLFERFNLSNPNVKAVEIGLRNLGGLGKAVGIPVVTDTGELVNKVVDGRVKIKPAGNGYDADNEVAAFAPAGSKTGGQAKLDDAPAKGGGVPKRTPGPGSVPPAPGKAATPPAPSPAPTAGPPAAAAPATAASAPKADAKAKMPWE